MSESPVSTETNERRMRRVLTALRDHVGKRPIDSDVPAAWVYNACQEALGEPTLDEQHGARMAAATAKYDGLTGPEAASKAIVTGIPTRDRYGVLHDGKAG